MCRNSGRIASRRSWKRSCLGVGVYLQQLTVGSFVGAQLVENSSSRFYLISCSQGILNSARLLLLSSPKIACLHVSFTAYENFYKLSKMHCHLVLTFLFLILRMSECRNPTIKHISTYSLVSSSITTYVTDLFLGSNLHSKIPF